MWLLKKDVRFFESVFCSGSRKSTRIRNCAISDAKLSGRIAPVTSQNVTL